MALIGCGATLKFACPSHCCSPFSAADYGLAVLWR
jgi:hypothetical protein